MHIPAQTLTYLFMIFGLLVVPRALQRFRVPAPLTCFALGILAAIFLKQLVGDPVGTVVATFGIAALFLLAGLEVDLVEIRHQLPQLSGYLATRAIFLAAFAWVGIRYFHMSWQASTLLALGLLTPSTGFILDTLPNSGLDISEQGEVSIDAIAGEIMALLLLFFVSQSGSMVILGSSALILLLLIVITPFLFLFFGKYVVPYAPGSEFSLLLMVGIVCAVITQNIGIHYLIGAFIAGLIASLLKTRMATLASNENLHAVRLFSSFFIPFYFFHEGMDVPAGALVLKSLLYGVLLSVIVIPIRICKNWLQTRYLSRRTAQAAFRVAIALEPTLIFTIVIAGVLHEAFHIPDALYGGLLIYAAVTTILPSLVLPSLSIPSEPEVYGVEATE
ncbi:cation:proton antiporter [Terriglobus roseus]|uniref:Transporter, CPA2 family n=1 Tax=Terriglobus roseus TaxID=392734 RepID=A0A1G7PPL7_9BACT|nr:cation:proton antiporter [Terriglobus roseus]SDF87380.1 transporter, CPA2 family [Terriglobus roseus]